MSINDGNIVLEPGEGKIVPVPGHKITHKVFGADTDGAYSLLEVELNGDGPPQHIHKTEDEAFYVLEGEINVLVGERNFKAKAGTFVRIPRGRSTPFVGSRRSLPSYSPSLLQQDLRSSLMKRLIWMLQTQKLTLPKPKI